MAAASTLRRAWMTQSWRDSHARSASRVSTSGMIPEATRSRTAPRRTFGQHQQLLAHLLPTPGSDPGPVGGCRAPLELDQRERPHLLGPLHGQLRAGPTGATVIERTVSQQRHPYPGAQLAAVEGLVAVVAGVARLVVHVAPVAIPCPELGAEPGCGRTNLGIHAPELVVAAVTQRATNAQRGVERTTSPHQLGLGDVFAREGRLNAGVVCHRRAQHVLEHHRRTLLVGLCLHLLGRQGKPDPEVHEPRAQRCASPRTASSARRAHAPPPCADEGGVR